MSIKKAAQNLAILASIITIAVSFTPSKASANNTGTTSNDILNINLSTGGTTVGIYSSSTEGSYSSNIIGSGNIASGKLLLFNNSIGGHMHINIGDTIELYSPSADTEYTDKIGFSGGYRWSASGGKGGNIKATDVVVGTGSARGGYGSTVVSDEYEYDTNTSIKYLKGSNGADTDFTNWFGWNAYTPVKEVIALAGGYLFPPYATQGDPDYQPGPFQRRSYSVASLFGSASYIQVSGNKYLVAAGGTSGVVYFEQDSNGAKYVNTYSDINADETPSLPNGIYIVNATDEFMSGHYSDMINKPGHVNYNRKIGTVTRVSIEDYNSITQGTKNYVDITHGFTGIRGTLAGGVLSNVYPAYSGAATYNETTKKFELDNTINVTVTGRSSSPSNKLTCVYKNVTIYNPTRVGYTFNGWDTSDGVAVKVSNQSNTTFKVSKDKSTITAKWAPIQYSITYSNNLESIGLPVGTYVGNTPSTTVTFDSRFNTQSNGYNVKGYNFIGWNSKKDGTGTWFGKGTNGVEAVNPITAGIAAYSKNQNWASTHGSTFTLYAIWEKQVYRYKIRLNSNDDSLGNWNNTDTYYVTNSSGSTDIITGQKVGIPTNIFKREAPIYLSNGTEVKKGYKQTGWAYSNTSKKPDIAIGSTVDFSDRVNSNGYIIDLYAVWEKEIELIIDPNKGELNGSNSEIVLSHKIYNNQYWYDFDISALYGTYDENGINSINKYIDGYGINYRFTGFNEDKDGIWPIDKYDAYSDKKETNVRIYDSNTIYAIWEPVLSMNVSIGRVYSDSKNTAYADAITVGNTGKVEAETSEKIVYTVQALGYPKAVNTIFDINFTEVYRLSNTDKSFEKFNDSLNIGRLSQNFSLDTTVYNSNAINNTIDYFYIPTYILEYQSMTGAAINEYTVLFEATNDKSYYWTKHKGKSESAIITCIIEIKNVTNIGGSGNVLPGISGAEAHKELKWVIKTAK